MNWETGDWRTVTWTGVPGSSLNLEPDVPYWFKWIHAKLARVLQRWDMGTVLRTECRDMYRTLT